MGFELILVLLVLALGWMLLSVLPRPGGVRLVAISLTAILILASAWTSVSYRRAVARQQPITNRPLEVETDGYVSSQTCRACHPHNYATWHASYHRTMTQVATPETVVGDFDDHEIHFHGRTYLLQRRGNEFWVEMDEPNWHEVSDPAPRIQRRVVLTTGFHHRQYVWLESGQGLALAQFPFTYLVEEQRWVHRTAGFIRPPSPNVSMHTGTWNVICIKCHTTHGQPRFSGSVNDLTKTRVAEFGIACEACHGPAQKHVRLHQDPQRRYQYHFSGERDPTIVHPEHLEPRLASQVCGQCHSIFEAYSAAGQRDVDYDGLPYRPGDDLTQMRFVVQNNEETRKLTIMKKILAEPTYLEDRFWSDGMVRVTGREYNGLIETPCYTHDNERAGIMSCLSCHQMHKAPNDPRSLLEWANDQLKPGMEGNLACLQCHRSFGSDLQQHTYHQPDSAGSLCYNCHMPHTTYGLHKAVRSHQVDSPSVAVSLETSRPNACNLCHLDRTLAWTADHLDEWYGIPPPELSEDEQSIAASVLWLLCGDAGQRVLVAWNMDWAPAQQASGTSWLPPFLAQLLLDPYDAVRFIAYRTLRSLPGFGDLDYDFEGPANQRLLASRQALAIWTRRQGTADRQSGPAILIDPEGNLQQTLVSRLLDQRNDRRVHLKE